jgi:hypothetical protein
MAQPIARFESSSHSNFVLFVSFVVAAFPLICSAETLPIQNAALDTASATLPLRSVI